MVFWRVVQTDRGSEQEALEIIEESQEKVAGKRAPAAT